MEVKVPVILLLLGRIHLLEGRLFLELLKTESLEVIKNVLVGRKVSLFFVVKLETETVTSSRLDNMPQGCRTNQWWVCFPSAIAWGFIDIIIWQ